MKKILTYVALGVVGIYVAATAFGFLDLTAALYQLGVFLPLVYAVYNKLENGELVKTNSQLADVCDILEMRVAEAKTQEELLNKSNRTQALKIKSFEEQFWKSHDKKVSEINEAAKAVKKPSKKKEVK